MSGGIGILDSGVGGLTVVKEVMRQLPTEQIIYIGDSARCPYGSRSPNEIRRFSFQLIEFLLQFNPEVLVIACNTATAVVLDEVRRKLSIPVIGVIEPGSRAAIRETKTGRIGVIGTKATIRSGMYEKVLQQIDSNVQTISHACPQLVPLVEAGSIPEVRAIHIIEQELVAIQNSDIDTLILGCTHYPIISHLIQKVVGDQVSLISSAEETAAEVRSILTASKPVQQRSDFHHFFTTGEPISFQAIAENWLGIPIHVTNVEIDQKVPKPIHL